MEILGMSAAVLALFVGFGLLIGTLFGFFGMGGSFLVTPALLVLGYPTRTAVGSGLAFVFGTSVIAALRHRDLGQVDYKLAALMTVGMTVGIEVGRRIVFLLDALGVADLVVSVAYVGLLAAVGLLTLREARRDGTDAVTPNGTSGVGALVARIRARAVGLKEWVQSVRVPPVVTLKGGTEVSVWVVGVVGLAIGVLSGFLGVGGGFLLMPAMMYGLGVPAAVAVGTDILQITVSGAFGAFVYAREGYVALPVVAALLAGSALGARVGAAATDLVDEDDIKGYFAAMLLAGSVAVAAKKLGAASGIEALRTVSVALIFGSALVVSAAVVLSAVRELRASSRGAGGSAS